MFDPIIVKRVQASNGCYLGETYSTCGHIFAETFTMFPAWGKYEGEHLTPAQVRTEVMYLVLNHLSRAMLITSAEYWKAREALHQAEKALNIYP